MSLWVLRQIRNCVAMTVDCPGPQAIHWKRKQTCLPGSTQPCSQATARRRRRREKGNLFHPPRWPAWEWGYLPGGLGMRLPPRWPGNEASSQVAWEWGFLPGGLGMRLPPRWPGNEATSQVAWEWGYLPGGLGMRLPPRWPGNEATSQVAWEWG